MGASLAGGVSLAELPVVFLDAQATAAHSSRGALLEIGWSRGSPAASLDHPPVESCAIAPPPGTELPRAVARLTGMSRGEWEAGLAPEAAWRKLLTGAAACGEPVPLVIHFARFELPFLRALHDRHARGPFPFEPICTHATARRLLPSLPRCTLRALAGYFGAAVPELRRSADHVVATAFVWRHLVAELDREGVHDLAQLREWLGSPARRPARAARVYPLPRERRLALPRGPGVYRFLRTGGAVVYVGKATSLRQRVSGHFHTSDGERALEMLSQVRDVSCTATATALEAALLEADEIKRLAPPYNRALTATGRSLWFASDDLCDLRPEPDERHTVGPLASAAPFESLGALREALASARRAPLVTRARALGLEPAWAPGPECFEAGLARFLEIHGRLSHASECLRLGRRLWAARRMADATRDLPADEPALTRRPEWDAARVLEGLEETVLRATHAVRRARWLLRLCECSLAWRDPGRTGPRLLTIERGSIVSSCDLALGAPAPPPRGATRSPGERRAAFDVPTFDRLRVLTTELRALACATDTVELRLGPSVRLSGRRLRTALWWV